MNICHRISIERKGLFLQSVKLLLDDYGYIVLFFSLILELIALPLPGETLMSYCGYLVYKGKLNWGISIIISAIGTIIGITISYFIGKTLGISFFHKYGNYIHMGPKKFKKVSNWFEAYGNKLLIISYFIPGVRHFTGYFSGITDISFKKFAINAYLGAFIWTFFFITFGKILGDQWNKMHSYVNKYIVVIGIILIAFILIVVAVKYYRSKIKDVICNLVNKIFNR